MNTLPVSSPLSSSLPLPSGLTLVLPQRGSEPDGHWFCWGNTRSPHNNLLTQPGSVGAASAPVESYLLVKCGFISDAAFHYITLHLHAGRL